MLKHSCTMCVFRPKDKHSCDKYLMLFNSTGYCANYYPQPSVVDKIKMRFRSHKDR